MDLWSKARRLRGLWGWELRHIVRECWDLPRLGNFRWVMYLTRLQHIRIEVEVGDRVSALYALTSVNFERPDTTCIVT